MIKIQGPNNMRIATDKVKKIDILLDMDGVISDWVKSACRVCDVDLNNKEIRDKLKNGADLNEIVPDQEMWDKINAEGEKFWLEMDLLPLAKKLYKALTDTGHKVWFCTSPGKDNPIPASPKIEYIQKHFKTNNFIITYDKSICAGPNKILIDDSVKKLKPFEEAGGKIFRWTNQYELIDNGTVDEVIKTLLNEIKSKE